MAVYYVGVGGNNANNGTTWALRRLTIASAVSLLSGGDTLYIGPGTYTVNAQEYISGSAGNETYILGDYTGANTDGVGGVVRVAGSNNIAGSYIVFRDISFEYDNSGQPAVFVSGGNNTFERCVIYNTELVGLSCRNDTTGVSNTVIRNCLFPGSKGGVQFLAAADVAGCSGNLVENCIFTGMGSNTNTFHVSNQAGVTVRNCHFYGTADYGIRVNSLPATESVSVYNCLFEGVRYALYASASGEIVEDYNNIIGVGTARTNVSTGANSTTHQYNRDFRWFFEAVGGGSMLTPFDLASHSPLVELNSGTGAPSADMRGTTVKGTYREWGPLEYDSTLDIEAGSGGGGGGPVIGSRVIRGLGAI